MEIRSDCPTNCKYIYGDKCVASECYKGVFKERFSTAPECNVISTTITLADLYASTSMYVSCLVCDESVKIPKGQESLEKVAICDKCKSAILKLRKMLEEKQNDERRD